MKQLITILCLLLGFGVHAQNFTLSGTVKDSTTGEDMIGATVYVKELSTGVQTNNYGFYSISLKQGTYTITIQYMGYTTHKEVINLNQNISKNFDLVPVGFKTKIVKITKKRQGDNVKSSDMSVNKINIATIKKIPALLGEVDVIKSVQLLPGVTTVGEGASGFNVRGGGIDQNLILLDEAPVFNSSHLFGFFSVFNPDAVKNVKLIKGGIPAKYGGRLASILDVRMKDGSMKEIKGSGGVGVIFSRLMLEGPIAKDKASFVVAGRRSYIDLLAKPFLNEDLRKSRFNFYDLTAKVNYIVDKNNRIYLSAYKGRDVFGSGDFGFDWGNTTTTLRWNRKLNPKVFSNLTGYFSQYDYGLGAEFGDAKFNWVSRIQNYSLKEDITKYVNPDYTLSFGGQVILSQYTPGTITITDDNIENSRGLADRITLENAVYIGNKWEVSEKFSTEFGLRFSNFIFFAKDSINYYGESPNLGKDPRPVTRKEYLDHWTNKQTYYNLEPRASVRYGLNKMSSVKASYNRMVQYLQLVSNTTASVPLDVWTPANHEIKPIKADQIAIGYFRNFGENDAFEFSVETYYKWLQDVVDYRDGSDLLLNEFLEGELLTGEGRAYGLEFYLKKNNGKLNGWVSYTLARSERKIEGINLGEYFPNRFDKAHNLNIVMMYPIKKKWEASLNFVLSTGTPATFPTDQFNFYGYNPPHNAFEKRNNYRIKPYHRMDLGVTHKRNKRSEWVFSIYNVYARKNPFSIYFQRNADNINRNEAIQYSVLGTFVPAVSYNFKF